MTEDTGGSRVSFTVKELLAEMYNKLERIEAKLTAKADAIDLAILAGRVTALEALNIPSVLADVPSIREQVAAILGNTNTRDAVQTALTAENTNRFSRNEKLAGGLFVAANIFLNVYQALYFH